MTNEWVETTLGDVVQIMYGKDHKHLQNGLIPVYGSGGIMRYADRSLFEDESILIPRKGTLNNIIYVNKPCWTVDTMFWTKINKSKAYPKFIFYQLTMINFVELNVGSAVPSLTVPVLNNVPLLLPPLPVQRRIADILGTLDDKIELNRRMNATLEEMARALFKSWFVDFEPVRAKLDGRWQRGQSLPGLPAHLYDLFPDQLVDSELGEIPKGWGVGRLDDVLTLQRGFDLPTPNRTHGIYPVMAASGPNGCHDKFMVHGPGVTTGRSGVLGRVFFIHGDFWPLNTSLWVKEFKQVSPSYAFHLLQSLNFEIFNSGSAVPTLNRNHVHNLQVIIPPKNIVDAFDAQVMQLMKRQKTNETQSLVLTTLRDTLLPKLLSGEVEV
jgi:type I restriction enzyme, S subunit